MKLRTYCLSCREHTKNVGSKRVAMTNKLIRDKSRCSECLSDKSQFMAQEDSKSSRKKRSSKDLSKEIQRIKMQKW